MPHQAALEVGGFVAVYVAAFGQAINHADYFWQEGLSLLHILEVAQVFDRRAGRLFVIATLQTAFGSLANAFER